MCDANAYLVTDGAEEVLLESVDLVEQDGDEVEADQHLRGAEDREGAAQAVRQQPGKAPLRAL